eukprot:jgi/Tetstr1/437740/TSEL_026394.t1
MRSSSFSTPARPRLMVAMSCTLLLLLIGIPAPATGLLGNLACSGHLLQNCGGANLVLESLQPPYDEKPEFCAPACVAAAASGPCEGTETGAGLVRSCDSLDCIGPVYSACNADSCSVACGEALSAPVCAPFNAELVDMNLDPEQRGAEGLLCRANTCAAGVNAACGPGSSDGLTDAVCSTACAAAIASPACKAVPGKVPANLTAVAGPDSPACRYRQCADVALAACGNITSNQLGPESATAFCSQACADALSSPTCSGTVLAQYATQYGPQGTACASLDCAAAVVEACGSVDTSSALAFSGTALPKVCSTECGDVIQSATCANANIPALSAIAGPDTVACQQAQCLVSTGALCGLDLSGSASDVFAANGAALCGDACTAGLSNPACQSSGLQAAHATYCRCAPALADTCGIDLAGPPAPWDQLAGGGALCSDACRALLDSGCAALLPATAEPLFDFMCGCGADLVATCDPLGRGPFTAECCTTAQAAPCDLAPVRLAAGAMSTAGDAVSAGLMSARQLVTDLPVEGPAVDSGLSDLRVVEEAVARVKAGCEPAPPGASLGGANDTAQVLTDSAAPRGAAPLMGAALLVAILAALL